MTVTRKKLIEVALPLKAINEASAREKSIRHGHPSTLHLWWARRPLAAARAVIFAQMVDDPSSCPEEFPTEEEQEKERQRLFRIIEELVKWENTTNEEVLQRARDEIWKSWRRACADNADHPRAKELFDPEKLPAFHDPFAGGGSLPLEAQRLGLEAYASDLNPVAVLINKAMIEIPPKFAGRPPVNPEARKEKRLMEREWRGAQGLAEDVRYYGKWMRDEAEKRIGHLYPKIEVTTEMARERPDLKPYVGRKLTVIAWLWARTVKSPNPAFAHVDVPLASTFMLSTKPGKEAYVEPVIEGDSYRFTVKVGKPKDPEATKNGTKLARANFRCLMSGTPISGDYIKAEGKAGWMGARMMAIVAEGNQRRIYLPPVLEHEMTARRAKPEWELEGVLVEDARAFTPTLYGLAYWRNLFTPRQLVALTTFADLLQEVSIQVNQEASEISRATTVVSSGASSGSREDAITYTKAIVTHLALAVDRGAESWCSIARWQSTGDKVAGAFGRQAIPMVWDYADVNPFSSSTRNFLDGVEWVAEALSMVPAMPRGFATQEDAAAPLHRLVSCVSTDPPYYDNVGYADLSDYFYVWLRHSLKEVYPELFATVATPKTEELIASPYRHGGKDASEQFFLDGMTRAMYQLAEYAHPDIPVSIYYAFKQAKSDETNGTISTGWEAFLDAVIRAGFAITGTWPMRTERPGRMRETGSNALASSIVIVCRPRALDVPTATRREFLTVLRAELPAALAHLQKGNIAPVDLAQAAIGPGMAVYTRYSRVLDAEGKAVSVRDALALINQTLDEVLAEQEGDCDAETRWALAWFESYGFGTGEFGVAETLSKAKNTSVEAMAEANILTSRGGKVRLFGPSELSLDWDPDRKKHLTVWETVHHLIRALEMSGEPGAAELVSRLGSRAEPARDLAYRLYTICERRKRAQEALSYNGLVISWPEIMRLAREDEAARPSQAQLL